MDTFSVILLGIIQGLTEFLPVSSSGHLVLAQTLIPNFSQPGVLMDVILHFGTLFAVFIYFWKSLLKLNISYLKILFVGSIPAAFVGIFFRKVLEDSFTASGLALGIQFVITSLFCFWVDKANGKKESISTKDSFLIGIFQAVAIVPAISRSGATIFAATKRGISKRAAAEFSFLLSIPAILGANIIELYHYRNNLTGLLGGYVLGFVVAAIFGYLSIHWTMKFLKEGKFKIFGIYTLILAIIVSFI